MPDFADKLSALMEKSGESQSSLSRKSGVTQTLISAYLRRLNQPSWANVQLIAKALGVRCHDLEDDNLKQAEKADDVPPVAVPAAKAKGGKKGKAKTDGPPAK